MKVRDLKEKKGFEPVSLEVTIESELELKLFWNLLNCPQKSVTESLNTLSPRDAAYISPEELGNINQIEALTALWISFNRALGRG